MTNEIRTLSYEKYNEIAEMLAQEIDFEPVYSIEEIAEQCSVSVEVVKYINRTENE